MCRCIMVSISFVKWECKEKKVIFSKTLELQWCYYIFKTVLSISEYSNESTCTQVDKKWYWCIPRKLRLNTCITQSEKLVWTVIQMAWQVALSHQSHLQHQLTVLSTHKYHLSREAMSSPRAAHQEPWGHTHLHSPTGKPQCILGNTGQTIGSWKMLKILHKLQHTNNSSYTTLFRPTKLRQ